MIYYVSVIGEWLITQGGYKPAYKNQFPRNRQFRTVPRRGVAAVLTAQDLLYQLLFARQKAGSKIFLAEKRFLIIRACLRHPATDQSRAYLQTFTKKVCNVGSESETSSLLERAEQKELSKERLNGGISSHSFGQISLERAP